MVNYAEIERKTCMRLVTTNYDISTLHIDQLFSDIESNAYKLLTNYI